MCRCSVVMGIPPQSNTIETLRTEEDFKRTGVEAKERTRIIEGELDYYSAFSNLKAEKEWSGEPTVDLTYLRSLRHHFRCTTSSLSK